MSFSYVRVCVCRVVWRVSCVSCVSCVCHVYMYVLCSHCVRGCVGGRISLGDRGSQAVFAHLCVLSHSCISA
jgi:hypothetical protein